MSMLTTPRCHSTTAILLAHLHVAHLATAELFYSTDTVANSLVRIDSETGVVTTVGPLGFDATAVDLANIGTRLFAINDDLAGRVDLHEINHL